MSEFEAIILDQEGVQLVGPTIYPGSPGRDLRVAVSPRLRDLMLVDAEPEPTALAYETITARCEQRRGDGVYIFRTTQTFRGSL